MHRNFPTQVHIDCVCPSIIQCHNFEVLNFLRLDIYETHASLANFVSCPTPRTSSTGSRYIGSTCIQYADRASKKYQNITVSAARAIKWVSRDVLQISLLGVAKTFCGIKFQRRTFVISSCSFSSMALFASTPPPSLSPLPPCPPLLDPISSYFPAASCITEQGRGSENIGVRCHKANDKQ